jgi:hypothetical protein
MELKEKMSGRIGITGIILLTMMLVPVATAGDIPAFPSYIESVTPGVSVDVVIRTGGDTQTGQNGLAEVPEDECVMTELSPISAYDLLDLFSTSRLAQLSSISEYDPTISSMHGENTEYQVSGSIARAVQSSLSRTESIAQARSDIISRARGTG